MAASDRYMLFAVGPHIIAPAVPPAAAEYDTDVSVAWYGNIQYLINISATGFFLCLFVFLFVKLRSDHREIPGPGALITKLLAVWHATGKEVAHHCGADAAQFLIIEGGTFAVISLISLLSVCVVLPLNLYAGNEIIGDEFSKTTINHIEKGSNFLWVHFVLVAVVASSARFGVKVIDKRLRITRFRDGNGNLSDPNANSTAIFSVMVKGLPKRLGDDWQILHEYFCHQYPEKVHKVIVPMDFCALNDLVHKLALISDQIIRIENLIALSEENAEKITGDKPATSHVWMSCSWRRVKDFWDQLASWLGYTNEEGLRKLREKRVELESNLAAYKLGHGPGAGVAFVIFKDVYAANKCIEDFLDEKKSRFGKFFSIMELRLRRNQWKVERAPLATDIYWNNLGSTNLSLKLWRLLVNTCLVLMLLFFSSPLAVATALTSAARIINAEAIDNAQSWLSWMQVSSWFASLMFQFLPNVIVFVSMYIIVPSTLSYLTKFERHLTVSGEQRAALLKMVCFFLVNLIFLRALVESSLESAILKMGRCYLNGEDCRRIEQYMSASFLSKSCLSSLAFLITSTFLGISFDLLAPIPWIKKRIQGFGKNDMLQLVPEQNEEFPFENPIHNSLQSPLMQDLTAYPISRTCRIPSQKFDFAQYYAFNLTIFALTLIYSSFCPLLLPVGAVYFGYRYVVDKYNFLFVYRVRGFPAGNDGRFLDIVLSIMRFCIDLFLVSMLWFFSVHGDSMKIQALFTLGLLLWFRLLPFDKDGSSYRPVLLEGVQTIDNIDGGSIDYEVFSEPRFTFDALFQ